MNAARTDLVIPPARTCSSELELQFATEISTYTRSLLVSHTVVPGGAVVGLARVVSVGASRLEVFSYIVANKLVGSGTTYSIIAAPLPGVE